MQMDQNQMNDLKLGADNLDTEQLNKYEAFISILADIILKWSSNKDIDKDFI